MAALQRGYLQRAYFEYALFSRYHTHENSQNRDSKQVLSVGAAPCMPMPLT